MEIGLLASAALLGLGLAADAFSVSLADGLQAPRMSARHTLLIAALFAFFQGAMPLFGYLLVHGAVRRFTLLERYVPFAALFLLLFIGGKMLLEGIFFRDAENVESVGLAALLAQGVATSIDALSVGLTLADHPPLAALASSGVIALVTFPLCLAGVAIGKKFGTGLAGGAAAVGGLLLILIGAEIFFSGI